MKNECIGNFPQPGKNNVPALCHCSSILITTFQSISLGSGLFTIALLLFPFTVRDLRELFCFPVVE